MDWPEVELGCITRIRNGTVDPSRFPDETFELFSIPGFDEGRPEVVSGRQIKSVKAIVAPGDVLFSKLNPRIPRVWVVPNDRGFRQISSTEFWPLICDSAAVDREFLRYFLLSPLIRDRLSPSTVAATKSRSRIKPDQLLSERIPLPSPTEQRCIVDILDKANRLRYLRIEADTKADRIVPALIMRVLGSPKTWERGPHCKPLEELVRPVSGATPSKKVKRFWANDIPWITPKDMKRDFLLDSQIQVSRSALDETNLKVVERGSALIVVRGMILARDVPVAVNLCPVTINQDMKALIPKSKEVTGAYIWAALRLAKERLRALVGTAGHGTRKLDSPELMQFSIPQPSSEQLKQVESVVAQYRLSLERRQESRRLVEHLFAVSLRKAFDGSLTSEWRETHQKKLLQEMEHQASRDDVG